MPRFASALPARIGWILAIGILAFHVGAAFYYGHERLVDRVGVFAGSVADRAVALETYHRTHPDVLALISDPRFRVAVSTGSPGTKTAAQSHVWPHSREIATAVRAHATLNYPHLADRIHTRVLMPRRGPPALDMHVPTTNGQWLHVQAPLPPSYARRAFGPVWMVMLAGMIWLGVWWGMRRITRHLPRFVDGVERLGRGTHTEPLPVTGPKEIQRATRAFNAMQERLGAYLTERSAMVGAFSHDIRTLVARLQLRAEQIPDPEQKARAEDDLAAITRIVDETLAFARDEQSEEPHTRFELATMLASLVDDEVDLGRTATYEGPARCVYNGQRTALQRAFTNLIDNAIRYGGSASVALDEPSDAVVIRISDEGQGFPEADEQRALKPYSRIESSRNRDTGGTGLGLSIAANVIARHDGSLSFERPPSGFVAVVTLPRLAVERTREDQDSPHTSRSRRSRPQDVR